MAVKPLPRWVSDELNVRGWKQRDAEVLDHSAWVRDGVMITVNVGRSRDNFVVSYRKLSTVWNRLLDTNQLHQLIDKGAVNE